MASSHMSLALLCLLAAAASTRGQVVPARMPGMGQYPGQLPGQVPGQVQVPAAAKVTPLVVPAIAKKLFNQPQLGFTASYYGGQTDGGSCGYGSAQESGYGVNTLSASLPVYGNGNNCGACYTVTCLAGASRLCLPGKTPVLTLTNRCTAASGPCAGMKKSFSLAPAIWNGIAVNPNVGIVPVSVTRVPCLRAGGVSFKVIVANPNFVEVLISNVAGSGVLARVEAMVAGTPGWQVMKQDYGAVYSLSNGAGALTGVNLSIRLTSALYRESVVIRNAITAPIAAGRIFPTTLNFRLTPPRLAGAQRRGRRAMETFNSTIYLHQ